MSWLTTLGHYLKVGITDAANLAAPIMPLVSLIPGVGTIAATVFGGITAVEQLISPAGSGAAKKATVLQIVNAVHPGLNQTVLGDSIDAIVSALNALETALAKVPAAPVAPAPPA
jgi:hypothetical protein